MIQIPASHSDNLAASALYILRCVTYSAFAFHIWEWASGFLFEVNHIWKKPPSSIVKWQYLCSRYLGIVGQLGNTIGTGYINSSRIVPQRFCLWWYFEQGIVSQGLLFSLEVSLILRLYALSNANNRLRWTLYALVFVEHTIILVCSILTLRQVEYIEACLPSKAYIETAIIGCALGVTQCVLWGLTIQSTWRKRVPLSSLVMRDGSLVFAVLSIAIVTLTTSVCAPKHRPVFNPFSIIVAILVSTNCRIIINLEGMPQKQRDATSMIEFTSFIDTGEYAIEIQSNHS